MRIRMNFRKSLPPKPFQMKSGVKKWVPNGPFWVTESLVNCPFSALTSFGRDKNSVGKIEGTP